MHEWDLNVGGQGIEVVDFFKKMQVKITWIGKQVRVLLSWKPENYWVSNPVHTDHSECIQITIVRKELGNLYALAVGVLIC